MQAVADLYVLDLAQPAIDMQQHVVEDVFLWSFGQPQVVIHLRRLQQRPDLLSNRRQLARVERGDVGVLVQQLLQTCDVSVTLGSGHRRDQVVDQRRMGTTLGLGALAGVVHEERVDHREVAQCRVGST